MKVKIIKGTKQIGGCITEISTDKSRIIIDFGEDLDSNDQFELEGLTKGVSKYDAVFITHSHSDHIGLINKINNDIPIYVEEFTKEIYDLTCDFCNKERVNRKVNTFKLADNKKNDKDNHIVFNNNDIKVYAYLGDHSSYNSVMYLVEGDGKKVLHTGDFRGHGRRSEAIKTSIKKIGKVDILITEGTTLTRTKDKYMTEKELENEASKIMSNYNQVLVLQSSTNIDRTVSFLKASLKNDKKYVLDLFSYYLNNIHNYFIVDYKNIFVWKPYVYNKKQKWFKDKYLDIKTSSEMFPNYTMEVKESMLVDIKMLYEKGLLNNACLIYSMWEGYIEKEDKLNDFINELKKMNIDIKYLHTSGHSDLEMMSYLNKNTNPDKTVIIHTENSNLGKDIFNSVIDLNDGEYIEV